LRGWYIVANLPPPVPRKVIVVIVLILPQGNGFLELPARVSESIPTEHGYKSIFYLFLRLEIDYKAHELTCLPNFIIWGGVQWKWMSIAIRNAWIVTQNKNRDVFQGDILIEKDIIRALGKVRSGADIEIEANGDVVIPGLINTHTHVAMALMKGIADDLPFSDFLSRVFSYDSRRTPKDIKSGAMLGCLEMIRSGTTTFVDLYYSEDIIADAVQSSGLRGVLCWAVLDPEHTTQTGLPLDNCRRFCESFKNMGRIVPAVGLQGVYVCSTKTFVDARDYAHENDLLLHFHLSETRKEVNDLKKREGSRPVEYLNGIGFLGSECLAAHAAWLTLNEVRILGRCGTSISTCPVSNMKLATGGVAPIPEMLNAGVNVSIGTDGSTTNNSLDMFGEMKTLGLLQKSNRWDPSVLRAQQLLDFATIGGAMAIGLESSIGSIEVGKKADIAIMDGRAPNLNPLVRDNLVSNIVYSSSSQNVKTVICDGRLTMRDWIVMTLEEDSVLSSAVESARELMG